MIIEKFMENNNDGYFNNISFIFDEYMDHTSPFL